MASPIKVSLNIGPKAKAVIARFFWAALGAAAFKLEGAHGGLTALHSLATYQNAGLFGLAFAVEKYIRFKAPAASGVAVTSGSLTVSGGFVNDQSPTTSASAAPPPPPPAAT